MQVFQRKAQFIQTVQYLGAESIELIQAFMAPASPLYGPASDFGSEGHKSVGNMTLRIRVRDLDTQRQYPGLGAQYKDVPVQVADHVVKDEDGGFRVLTEIEITRDYLPEPTIGIITGPGAGLGRVDGDR